MSEICPCGSNLQIENCCIDKDIAKIKKISVADLSLPERIEWAVNYIENKVIHNRHIVIEQENYAESINTQITCKEKCSKCCVEFIAARVEECDAIAIYLYLYPELMNKFLTNYNAWHRNITSGDNILEKISEAYRSAFESRKPEEKKRFEDLALEYAGKYAQCPFLEDDKCIIYPIRPYTCSTYSVISDKKYCDPNLSKEEYIKNKLKVKSATHPLFLDTEYFIDLKDRYIFGAMQKMIYNIVKYGPFFLEKS